MKQYVRRATDPTFLNPDPYSLLPANAPKSGRQRSNWPLPSWDPDVHAWTIPHPLGEVNMRVAMRSAGLEGYSRQLHTSARVVQKSFIAALLATFRFGILLFMLYFRLTSWLLFKFLPAPGGGPSKDEMKRTRLVAQFIGDAKPESQVQRPVPKDDKTRAVGTLTTPTDPGYSFTAVQIVTCAMLLVENKFVRPGVTPPATAFGNLLLPALQAQGLTWTYDS